MLTASFTSLQGWTTLGQLPLYNPHFSDLSRKPLSQLDFFTARPMPDEECFVRTIAHSAGGDRFDLLLKRERGNSATAHLTRIAEKTLLVVISAVPGRATTNNQRSEVFKACMAKLHYIFTLLA